MISIILIVAAFAVSSSSARGPGFEGRIPGHCPMVAHAEGLTNYNQMAGDWFKVAQSDNPLTISSGHHPNLTITCASDITLEQVCNCDDQRSPKFIIHDHYTNKSGRMPEVSSHGKVFIPDIQKPGFMTIEMFGQGSSTYQIIEFKDKEYMFAFNCDDLMSSPSHASAEWFHFNRAILFVHRSVGIPKSLTTIKKSQYMDMMDASMKKNGIDYVTMSFVGGLVNGENC